MKRNLKRPKKEMMKAQPTSEDFPEDFLEDIDDEEITDDEKSPKNQNSEIPEKRFKTDLYKAPTREELNTLKENETLFQSSLFRLQIDELLSAVKVKGKVHELFRKFFESFSSTVRTFKESSKFDIHDLSWLKNSDIQIPFISYPLPHKGMFQFIPPERIKVIGGFSLNVSVKSNLIIDISCEMPKNCLQNDDCLNYCYHYKRALYLSYLAMMLQEVELIDNLSFQYFHGDTLKPVLLLKPSGKFGKYATVRVLISLPKDKFKWSKFHPKRSNIRSECLLKKNNSVDLNSRFSTQCYNNSILSDILMEDMAEFLQENLRNHQGICDGIILLKIWLHQRYMDQGYGSINGFVISMLVAYLLMIKKLNPFMSSYQIVRSTWLALSTMKWESQGIIMCTNLNENHPVLSDFHDQFSVVFVDPSGYLNLCGNMVPETFSRIKHEAESALKFLDIENNFEVLFMTPIPFLRRYDHVIRIANKMNTEEIILRNNLKSTLFAFGGNFDETITVYLLELLKKALAKRVLSFDLERKEDDMWQVNQKPAFKRDYIIFGILLDPENCVRLLDVGPPADSPEANDFRSFWGSKSELRRFPDGSISEAVLWEGKCISEKRKICSSIISYILKKHAGIVQEDVFYVGSQLDCLLTIPCQSWPDDWHPYGTGEEIFLNIMLTFDELVKELRALKNLPYTFISVQGTGASFRYTEVFPSVPTLQRSKGRVGMGKADAMIPLKTFSTAPRWIPTLDVHIKLEGEKKWPDDVEALRSTKASIYLILAKLIKKQFQYACVAYPEYLDISKAGFVFRLKIAHTHEVTLLKMEKTSNGLLRLRTNEASSQLEIELTSLPKYTSIVHGIQMQHNTFSTACRLAKRWISSQLLGDHVSEIAVELIVVYVYLFPSPYPVPRSPQVAFQRFLSLLSRFDWQRFPFIVNFNDEIKKDELAEIHKIFNANRSSLPPMFISTPLDKFTSTWTKNCPNMQVLNYLISLSKTALNVFEAQLIQNDSDFKQIFRPSYKPYDVIIHLRYGQVPKFYQSIDLNRPQTYEKYAPRKKELMPVVNYDPVQYYLNELKEIYSDFAEFFHDKHGGNVIAVMWKPSSFKSQPFKVSNISCHKLESFSTQESKTIIPNVEAMLDDFKNLGLGLVHSIEFKTEKWNID